MNVNYYATDALAEMMAVLVKLYFIINLMVQYVDRIKTYNPELCGPEEMEGVDATFLALLSLSFFAYGYRFAWGVINASIYYPLGHTDIPLVIHNLQTFFEYVNPEKEGYEFHLISFVTQLALSPKKVSLVTDLILLVGFILMQDWTAVSYIAAPWVPIAIMEFIIFPLYPYLEVPPIAFEAIVNGESVEIAKVSITEKDR